MCCYLTVEEYNARTDAQLRNRSLTLANIVCIILVLAHIGFAAYGKSLPMPEYFYCIVLLPYTGVAIRHALSIVGSLRVDKVETTEVKKK